MLAAVNVWKIDVCQISGKEERKGAHLHAG